MWAGEGLHVLPMPSLEVVNQKAAPLVNTNRKQRMWWGSQLILSWKFAATCSGLIICIWPPIIDAVWFDWEVTICGWEGMLPVWLLTTPPPPIFPFMLPPVDAIMGDLGGIPLTSWKNCCCVCCCCCCCCCCVCCCVNQKLTRLNQTSSNSCILPWPYHLVCLAGPADCNFQLVRCWAVAQWAASDCLMWGW